MPGRLELHELLCGVLGSRNVYFQPPESVKLRHPAIVYSLSRVSTLFADDAPYCSSRGYSITLIDEDPDSGLVERLLLLPTCRFDRSFARDGLHHRVFTIYF